LAGSVPSAPRPDTSIPTQTYNSSTSPCPEMCATSLTLANSSVFESLVLARTAWCAVERGSLLKNDDFVFVFDTPCRNTSELGVVTGEGGKTVRADHSTFPALIGSGGAVTIGFLKPCGFNSPHVHPRAAELNLVVEGACLRV
jgi:hypothetical protein